MAVTNRTLNGKKLQIELSLTKKTGSGSRYIQVKEIAYEDGFEVTDSKRVGFIEVQADFDPMQALENAKKYEWTLDPDMNDQGNYPPRRGKKIEAEEEETENSQKPSSAKIEQTETVDKPA